MEDVRKAAILFSSCQEIRAEAEEPASGPGLVGGRGPEPRQGLCGLLKKKDIL